MRPGRDALRSFELSFCMVCALSLLLADPRGKRLVPTGMPSKGLPLTSSPKDGRCRVPGASLRFVWRPSGDTT